MWVAFANAHIFSAKILTYNDQNFNDTLTNDVVSFEQLGPGSVVISTMSIAVLFLWQLDDITSSMWQLHDRNDNNFIIQFYWTNL